MTTGYTVAKEAIERELGGLPRTLQELLSATGMPGWQLRATLDTMAREGKVCVRARITGTEVVPTGNN